MSIEEVAEALSGSRTQKRLEEVGEILVMLFALGQIEEQNGKYLVA